MPCLGQEEVRGLKVQPDKDHIVANTMVGSWSYDATLSGRLGAKIDLHTIEFRTDASVLAKVPARIAAKLSDWRIYAAGVMVKKEQEHAYVLVNIGGNSVIIWFRERAGDPMGDTESWLVCAAPGKSRKSDLLFVGGDSAKEPFAAYGRAVPAVGKLTPQAALKNMADLIQAGRTMEFVKTYCSPADKQELQERGRSLEAVAGRFAGERGQAIAGAFLDASKVAPLLTENDKLATWELPDGPGPSKVMLQLLDGRWYLRSR
ncbi:MAG: hypothetical protein AB8H80_08405 [Planctomycetota bacterium]